MTELKNIPILTAAVLMDKSPQFVRRGLISGRLPFGTAVEGDGGRYSFYISPKLFMEYTGCTSGELLEKIKEKTA